MKWDPKLSIIPADRVVVLSCVASDGADPCTWSHTIPGRDVTLPVLNASWHEHVSTDHQRPAFCTASRKRLHKGCGTRASINGESHRCSGPAIDPDLTHQCACGVAW